MAEAYDGIVLGTGHNALVLQAYMARRGLRVLSLDRVAVAGGGLATDENPRWPGVLHNTHSFYHRALTEMPWYRDLELERHGVRYVEPELNVALLTRDGRALEWWTDQEKTIASFAEFSQRDAETARRWIDEFTPIVEEILTPEALQPPLPPEERRARLERTPEGRRLLDVSACSPLEWVTREFENETVQGGLLFFNGLREVDLRLPGFGHTIPALLASRRKAQMCAGGSARLAEGLVRDIEEHGGEVRTGVTLSSILLSNGRAARVELADGEKLEARAFIASGLNPQQTFLELCDPGVIPRELRERAAGFQYNLIAPLFALNLVLNEPPRYRHAQARPELERAFMVILGLDSLAQFPDMVTRHERGEAHPEMMWGTCPTLFDPSQAPEGFHTAFMWEKQPYALDGDVRNWETAQQDLGRRMLDRWAEYAPNVAEGAVLDWFTRSPLEVERTLPNMARGDLLVGAFANGQVGYHRPFPGAGHYRTPIPGLYLCGGCTHPGGNITGLCGYNAATVLASDLGL